jgi:hypothetical protein
MIVTRIIGGLGNQMFQYATARQLAETHHAKLLLDISGFKKYKLHNFSLCNFKISADLDKSRNMTKFTANRKLTIIKEKFYEFDKNILNLPDNVYLEGYWQSYKYFNKIRNLLNNEFALNKLPKGKNKNILNTINNSQSVAVHIRRQDYVNNKKTKEIHGICRVNYYQKALKFISSKVKGLQFFIFSDDIGWCKKKLHFNNSFFIDFNNKKKDYEDFRLMKHCKYFIIANSTFSWWAAWLGQKTNSIVISPKNWFTDSAINTSDLIPENWIKIV